MAAEGEDHRRRRDHEPRRDRGRALAGLAGRQPGAAHRPGAERPRSGGRRPARRLGRARRAAPRRRQRRPTTTRPGPTIMDAIWRPIAERGDGAAVRRPARRPRQRPRPRRPRRASPTSTRTCGRCSATTVKGKFNLRYCGKGDARRVPRRRCGTRSTRAPTASRPTSAAAIRRRGAARRARTGFAPGLLPEHGSRPRTGRRSSRCSSSRSADAAGSGRDRGYPDGLSPPGARAPSARSSRSR